MSHWLARGAVLLAGVIGMAIQPWSARRLLIEFGGSSAVWSATQVYFIGQLVLANLILSFFPKRGQRWQPILLVILLTLATLYLWMPKPWTVDSIVPQPLQRSVMAGVEVLEPSQSANPVLAIIFWLISRLGILPLGLFLVSPIIQLALARSASSPSTSTADTAIGKQSPASVYRLYAWSNAGSLLGVIGYPILVEPWLDMRQQFMLMSLLIASLLFLLASLVRVFRAGPVVSQATQQLAKTADDREQLPLEVRWTTLGYWLMLAFAPVVLSLAVTQRLTMDVTPAPWLWMMPLAVYLLTLMIAFSKFCQPGALGGRLIGSRVSELLFSLVLVASISSWVGFSWLVVPIHLSNLAVVSMVCHYHLARSAPPTQWLGIYYLMQGLGGLLAAGFVALICPVIFATQAEYPLAMLIAYLFIPKQPKQRLSLATRGHRLASTSNESREVSASDSARPQQSSEPWWVLACVGICLSIGSRAQSEMQWLSIFAALVGLLGLWWMTTPISRTMLAPFALVMTMLSAGSFHDANVLTVRRSFFGIHTVKQDREKQEVRLLHGVTVHGWQANASGEQCTPQGYFRPEGPVGDMFAGVRKPRGVGDNKTAPQGPGQKVAIVGLGTGAMACYAQAGDEFSFVEIDRLVADIALNPSYFTYLSACCKGRVSIQIADGRQAVNQFADGELDLLLLDAFSSDSIPAHLVTAEAFGIYLRKLKPTGVIGIQVTNRHVQLERVIAAIADRLHLHCRLAECTINTSIPTAAPGTSTPNSSNQPGNRLPTTRARFMIVAQDLAAINAIAESRAHTSTLPNGTVVEKSDWQSVPVEPHLAWTDDKVSIWPIMKW